MPKGLVLVKALANPRPIPAALLATIVVHAIEVAAPFGARNRWHVAKRFEQFVRYEDLCRPTLDFSAALRLRSTRTGSRTSQTILSRFANVPRSPTKKLAVDMGIRIGNSNPSGEISYSK